MGSYDDTIKLWDVASGRELRTLGGHSDAVNSVAFSPDGRILACGGPDDNTIKLWDVASGRELRTLRGHSKLVIRRVLAGRAHPGLGQRRQYNQALGRGERAGAADAARTF